MEESLKRYKEQRDIYGIDERETWNFADDLVDYIYIHLKMYNEVSTIIDKDFHKVVFKGEEITFQQAIDRIIKFVETEYYPVKFNKVVSQKTRTLQEFNKKFNDMCSLFCLILPYLTW